MQNRVVQGTLRVRKQSWKGGQRSLGVRQTGLGGGGLLGSELEDLGGGGLGGGQGILGVKMGTRRNTELERGREL